MEYTNSLQNYVKDFHEAFKHPAATTPTALEIERGVNRSIWTVEEIVEFLHASSSNQFEFDKSFDDFMRGAQQAYNKCSQVPFTDDNLERIASQVDALVDALYFLFGTAVEIGVDVEKIFEIVQESNMSKLFTDEHGNKYVKYRFDGKVLKSPEFFPPEMRIVREIVRQIKQ